MPSTMVVRRDSLSRWECVHTPSFHRSHQFCSTLALVTAVADIEPDDTCFHGSRNKEHLGFHPVIYLHFIQAFESVLVSNAPIKIGAFYLIINSPSRTPLDRHVSLVVLAMEFPFIKMMMISLQAFSWQLIIRG